MTEKEEILKELKELEQKLEQRKKARKMILGSYDEFLLESPYLTEEMRECLANMVRKGLLTSFQLKQQIKKIEIKLGKRTPILTKKERFRREMNKGVLKEDIESFIWIPKRDKERLWKKVIRKDIHDKDWDKFFEETKEEIYSIEHRERLRRLPKIFPELKGNTVTSK
jgi:hypothetical protein